MWSNSQKNTKSTARMLCVQAMWLLVVAISWYLSVMAIGLWLSLRGVSSGLIISATLVGPCLACLAAYMVARFIARYPMRRWLALAVSLTVFPIVMAGVCVHVGCASSAPQSLQGPASPGGLGVLVVVRDAGSGFGADYFSDVRVIDSQGNIVAEWIDLDGWGRSDGPSELLSSMRWLSSNALEFVGCKGIVVLTFP